MARYLIGRALWAVVLVVVVTFVMYVLFFLAPGGGLSLSGSFANDAPISDAGSTQEAEGDARPLAGYVQFLGHLLHGDLGQSSRTREDVTLMVAEAVPASASLILGGFVFSLIISMAVGLWSASRPRGVVDRLGSGFVLFGISAHPLWLGLMLAWLFGFVFRWMPITGYCDLIRPSAALECGGPVQWAYHLVLPWAVFTAAYAALYTRMIRSGVLECLSEQYVTAARAKGASELRIVHRHAFRNAALPIVTMLTMDIGLAFGSTIFVEHVFQVPGLGFITFNAIARRDLPVILGVIVFIALVMVVLSLIVDLLYALLDPRIRAPVQRSTMGA